MEMEKVEQLAEEMALAEWGSPLKQLPRQTVEMYKALAYGRIEEEGK